MLRPSVIIPAYNGAAFIAEAIASVIAQSLLPTEILVVDDASTDATAEVVEEIGRTSTIPIRLLRLPKNTGGPAIPMNEGIKNAREDIIALLDQDDLMLPAKIEIQLETLNRQQKIDLVLSDFEHFGSAGMAWQRSAREAGGELHSRMVDASAGIKIIEPEDCLNCFAQAHGLPLSCSNMMFRKTMWARVGGFAALAGSASDHDFLFRAIRKPIAWIDRILFRKRIHETNLERPTFESRKVCVNSHYLAARELKSAAALRQFVITECRDMAWRYRQRCEMRHALSESFRILRLGSPYFAILEAAKSSVAATLRIARSHTRQEAPPI